MNRWVAFFRTLFFKKEPGGEKIDLCIIGLGNPGETYRNNRHNIGFRIVDQIGLQLTDCKRFARHQSEILQGILPTGTSVLLVKPTTFMNASGSAVESLFRSIDRTSVRFIVVADDFNLPVGTMRFRKNGSHGGHNGLKSIIASIGSEFPRLRVGIGPLPADVAIIDFVLGDFGSEEKERLSPVLEKAAEALKDFAAQSFDAVMNKYN